MRHLPSFDQISDAQLVDMDPRRWTKDLQRELVRRRQQQADFAEVGRLVPPAPRAYFIGARSWLEYRAAPPSYRVQGLGVARPGLDASERMAESHHPSGLFRRRRPSASGRDSRLVTSDDERWTALIGIAATQAQIRVGIVSFTEQMATRSRDEQVAPVPLDLPADLLDRTHHALWDAISGTSLDGLAEIRQAMDTLAASVDERIDEAWAIRAAARVADPAPVDDPPVEPLRRTTHDLADVARGISENTEAARRAREEIQRLNTAPTADREADVDTS